MKGAAAAGGGRRAKKSLYKKSRVERSKKMETRGRREEKRERNRPRK